MFGEVPPEVEADTGESWQEIKAAGPNDVHFSTTLCSNGGYDARPFLALEPSFDGFFIIHHLPFVKPNQVSEGYAVGFDVFANSILLCHTIDLANNLKVELW